MNSLGVSGKSFFLDEINFSPFLYLFTFCPHPSLSLPEIPKCSMFNCKMDVVFYFTSHGVVLSESCFFLYDIFYYFLSGTDFLSYYSLPYLLTSLLLLTSGTLMSYGEKRGWHLTSSRIEKFKEQVH